MKKLCLGLLICSTFQVLGYGQGNTDEPHAPMYKLTVIGRTIQAVNYGHRSLPTRIDFAGTALLPDAKGGAIVKNERGATQIDAKFERLEHPNRFGSRFLTYVLWAITPDGRSANLGELVLDTSDRAKLRVSTEFPAFGLMVTAEPYFSVTKPSDAVVMENKVRPDTIGKVQVIEAKYELLPRGEFMLDKQATTPPGEMVRMDEYEAISAVYQAQNAVQIARAEGADRLAPEVFSKAVALFEQAGSYKNAKDYKQAVMIGREAAQTAEDARAIAQKRAGQDNQIESRLIGSERQ
jgi:hypothetical protein